MLIGYWPVGCCIALPKDSVNSELSIPVEMELVVNRYLLVTVLMVFAPLLSAEPPQKKTGDLDEGNAKEIDPNDRPISYWMEKKLEYSQQALKSLATGDLEDVQLNATRMNLLNRVEGFVRRKNPNYQRQLSLFNHVSADLAKQAKDGNIEGATLAFNQLTVSCVKCHQTLRKKDGGGSSAGDSRK